MTTPYIRHVVKTSTPQSQPIPGRTDMVANQGGGFVFEVTPWTQLERFLILGCEGPTYYATEQKMTASNVNALKRCLDEDGVRAVKLIVDISVAGRAPKESPALFALAYAAKLGDERTRKSALAALPAVARTASALFSFIANMKALSEGEKHTKGWSRGMRNAVQRWYGTKQTKDVVYQAIKYQNRDGYAHKDAIRLAHVPFDVKSQRGEVMHWMLKGWDAIGEKPHPDEVLVRIWAHERIKKATAKEAVKLIQTYDLPRESIPTELLNDVSVWEALLEKMPLRALTRNLAKMTAIGLIKPMSDAAKLAAAKLTNAQALKKARVHPLALLLAKGVYQQGHGVKGSLSWAPVPSITAALDTAFYLAFDSVEPTGKRFYVGVDVSGSMGTGTVAGAPGISPRLGACALALVIGRTEPDSYIAAFSSTPIGRGRVYMKRHGQHVHGTLHGSRYQDAMSPFPMGGKSTLDEILRNSEIMSAGMGGTDCSLPIMHALDEKIMVDCFVTITDNETWAGNIHPTEALKRYRREVNPGAKAAVIAMTGTPFSIADPSDTGQMDFVGFDAALPLVLADFASGGKARQADSDE